MRLVFVRHGQTATNVARVLESSIPGPPLTVTGWSQAKALPAALAGRRVDAIYASTQVRALQTASPLAASSGRPIHVRHGLREVAGGEFEGRADAEAIAGYWDAIGSWAAGDLGRRVPGGESGREVFARVDAVVEEVAASYESVVIVSHGGIIRGWAGARAGLRGADSPLDNTGIVELAGHPDDGWRLTSWSSAPYFTTPHGRVRR